ncbi:KinB-signaling pathway activation protein [Bacillaceae bacterium SIJ1]|uniref:KinB-signaling pathway activation protein n=1 Tax=Litoribacterium kuwaitense TaxID=1398745 RepID=UPI0013EA9B19|nr:KinB-signaling pathway activation protein [Litoribacterium kuwaitense]NGP46655.1 KinB-signaling pathway activation protein [Litoribacterium kuwaitense]
MNSRKWVYLFTTTLAIGIVATIIAGFIIRWSDYKSLFTQGEIGEILVVALWFLGIGAIFSLISQMGFFAYLFIHRFGLGIFKTISLWNAIQIVLIAFALFDLFFFRYQAFGDGGPVAPYVWPAVLLLLFSLPIAALKAYDTNTKEAFPSALFFMVVVTMIEWFPVLRENEWDWVLLMIIPLFLCNAWQVLILHRLVGTGTEKKSAA